MVCCLLCFDGSPVPEDPKSHRHGMFRISMMESLIVKQPYCMCSYLLPCCAAYYTRYRVLEEDMSQYSCCQGYYDVDCFQSGNFGESGCPQLCLCLESFLCLGPSASATRLYHMDRYYLRSDSCDNKMIRFTNCLMCLSCICGLAEVFFPPARNAHRIINCVSETVFYSAIGCMLAQVNADIDLRRNERDYNSVPGEDRAIPIAQTYQSYIG